MAISILMVRASCLVVITAVISSHVNSSCSTNCSHVSTSCSKECSHVNMSCSKNCSHVKISCCKDCSPVNTSCSRCFHLTVSCSRPSSSQSHVNTTCPKDCSHVNNWCSKYCRCNLDSSNRTAPICDIRGMNRSIIAEICLLRELFSL